MVLSHSHNLGCIQCASTVDVAVVGLVSRKQAPTYLALVIGSVRRRLQCALQSALIIPSSQQLPYLLRSVLHIGG